MTTDTTTSQGATARLVLGGEANSIVAEVRQTIAECQGVLGSLATRDQVDPVRIAEFSNSVGQMLVKVIRTRDQLVTIDCRLTMTSQTDPHIKRYRELSALDAKPEKSGGIAAERWLRREMALAKERYENVLSSMKIDIRQSMTYRLELLRDWSWFVRQAIRLYGILAEASIANLSALRNLLPEDDELRSSIDVAMGNHTFSDVDVEIRPGSVPSDIQEIRQAIEQEIAALDETQGKLSSTRKQCKELENTEILLEAEIKSQLVGPVDDAPMAQPLGLESAPHAAPPMSPSHRMAFHGKRSR